MAKFSCEMRVVAKAAGVGDRTDRLLCAQQLAAFERARGLVQAKRIDEIGAGKAAQRKELLQVAQRDPGFGCRFRRAKIRIGKTFLDEAADAEKQPVRMACGQRWFGWR